MVQPTPQVSSALPPPPRDRAGLPWLKIGLFLLFVLVLAGLANVLLDGGLGRPDEARRARHPAAGFSIGLPIGWGGTNSPAAARSIGAIRLAADRSAGRQTSIVVMRLREPPKTDAMEPTTFQDQPAWMTTHRGKYDWSWRLDFSRDGAWFEIVVTSPIQLDMTSDPLLAYVRSFRVEPTTASLATSFPTAADSTSAATEPAATGTR